MSSLVTAADVRVLVKTDLSDPQLQAIIDREEAALIRRLGPHEGPVTEVLEAYQGRIFTSRPITSVSTINGTMPESSAITVLGAQGQIVANGAYWGLTPAANGVYTVVYTPADDTAERKAVIIELVRIAVERTAMKSESVAGEYSYTAPENWEQERRQQYRRLVFTEI